MASQPTDVRLLLSEELKDIRSKIVEGKLVLFVGEQVSTLVSPENPRPSLDDWWKITDHAETGIKFLFDLENAFLENLQLAPSRVHNVLRNVGRFPLIITTNMDELLERFLWKTGNGGEKLRLDQISCLAQSWPDLRRDLIIKCLGDSGFNARTLPSSKKFFEEFCSDLKSSEVELMHQVFNDRSVLFLGCDPARAEYKNFFQKFAVNAKMKHYKFETYEESDLERNGNLLTLKANIQPWEFVQFLSTGTIQEEIQPGQVYERSYLRIQREEYLQQQLTLEKMASEIIFHTINITNALSPDEYFEQISRPAIQDMFAKDPFGVYSEQKVQRTLDAMKGRRDNLHQLISESQASVTALFFYHGVKKEIELWKKAEQSPPLPEDDKQNILQKCKISISKYAKAILLCKSFMRSNSSLEILIVGDQETYQVQEVEKETFALIRLKGGTDEAICYAETASSPEDRKFASHLININGEEVLNKRKVYERSRANAWSNEDSILKLATAIMKESAELKKNFGIDAIEKKDLDALETLTRISQKVRSQLDPGYLEPLGEGSFGQVFQAKKDGRPVAVKILKNIESRKQIQDFEREVDMLREAKHPKIVEVIECISIQNQLAIVMEFMAGGNLKMLLDKNQGRGQGKEFTLRFTEDIGSALEHLHSLNIIHRDVKPENIFLSVDHTVLKLGDFGLARATEGTRQTKTQIGSYRYMAPEVVSSGGHYSKKADVHSYGLCLIEVLSGKTVFHDILQHETVFNKKMAGDNPSIPDISVEEFGEELATKLKTIIDECLKPEKSRPEMHLLLSILKGKITSHKNRVELYCVGTGAGTTAVLHGKPSSSAVIFHGGKPLLMADVGAGVLKPYREKLAYNEFPRNVFITHNHLDHAGELPMLFVYESKRRYQAREPRLRVLSGPEVEHKLKTHRLDEMLSLYKPEQVADWVVCKPGEDPTYLDDDKHFFIKTYQTLHGEVCYGSCEKFARAVYAFHLKKLPFPNVKREKNVIGFVLYFKDKPILGYCVDSGFKEDVYEFFFEASNVIVDARETGSKEHASFTEVAEYVKKTQHKDTKVYITGYGIDSEYPDEGVPGVEQLRADQYITLWDDENDQE